MLDEDRPVMHFLDNCNGVLLLIDLCCGNLKFLEHMS
jgi:hypothetical protein